MVDSAPGSEPMTTGKVVFVVFGNAGHGKDTLSDFIAGALFAHGSTLRLAFADPIKETAEHLIGIPAVVSYANAAVKESTFFYGKTARHWLQWIGTEIGRQGIHEDVWAHRLADTVLRDPVWKFAVVSDGRFENERTRLAPYFLQHDPTVRVVNVLVHRPAVPVHLTHKSESEVSAMRLRAVNHGESLFHRIVANTGTLEELRAHAENMVAEVLT